MPEPFRVGITRDFLKADGTLGFGDIGLAMLEQAPHIACEFLPDYGSELPPQVASEFDALLVLAPKVTARTLGGATRLTLVARFGVGYDNVDTPACTRHDVMLTITPSGVRRPVAVSALALMLALSHKLMAKDRMTREGRWHDKLNEMGVGVTGRTLGLIGLGNIGREILRVVAPLDMRYVAYDPHVSADVAREAGAELLSLDDLLERSDFICVCCALTADTHHLLDAERLARMKPSSFLINVARGPIIDQRALTAVLSERRIAGAALDVFEKEPIDADDPLLKLDNVILAPHAICWTDELFLGNGRAACQSILDVSLGVTPRDVVNRDVLASAMLQQKLARFAAARIARTGSSDATS
ncbi:MAG TPA: NAD(P)-dependent oxidoreductase, partial [Pirellulaceae bacterium]|nr:NAD(P)-dependent oxidoreductase [Pirellulaceae bacterium]